MTPKEEVIEAMRAYGPAWPDVLVKHVEFTNQPSRVGNICRGLETNGHATITSTGYELSPAGVEAYPPMQVEKPTKAPRPKPTPLKKAAPRPKTKGKPKGVDKEVRYYQQFMSTMAKSYSGNEAIRADCERVRELLGQLC